MGVVLNQYGQPISSGSGGGGGGAPSGPAGGDLGGTYPNPTVVDLSLAGEAQGDLLARGAGAWQPLTPGTAGQFLRTAGAGVVPTWALPFQRITVAGALLTLSITPASAGLFQWIPGDFPAATPVVFRVVISIAGGATATVTLRNRTDAVDVEIGGPGDVDLTTASAAPVALSSVNLVGAVGWSAGTAIYEVRVATSSALQAVSLGIAELRVGP